MSPKNAFLFILSSVLACTAWYQIISLIQWNWQFQTWHWVSRLLLILFSLGAITKYLKEFKDDEKSNSNT